MLRLTKTGFTRSTGKHNCTNEIVADWVLASVLLCEDGEVSKTDIIDVLLEQGIYDDNEPDYCAEYVNIIWVLLRNQISPLGDSAPVSFRDRTIIRKSNWQDAPVFTFFVILYLNKYLGGWYKKFGSDYTEQGVLFEKICAFAIGHQFSDFEVMITGWSRDETASFSEVAEKVAAFVSEQTRPEDIAIYTNKNTKELGLDLVWTNEFRDGRGGNINFLAQCASGHDMVKKLKTPEMELWKKIIRWNAPPSKAFMTPFAISELDFPQLSVRSEGIFFDRYRILVADKTESEWIDKELMASLTKWLTPRITWLLGEFCDEVY